MDAQYLTIEDTARLLNVDRQTVTKLIKLGSIPATKVGTRVRIAPSDVQTYLERNKVKPE